jgi:N-acetylglutamate synthase-like GNAT family acetyltransferase
MSWIIRKATLNDMQQVALIHKQEFARHNDHLIGKLPIFLISRFYQAFLNDNNIFIIAEYEHKVVGFILGGYDLQLQKCRNCFMKKNIICLIFSSLFSRKIWKVFFRRLLSKNTDSHITIPANSFHSLSGAVLKQMQGAGVYEEILKYYKEDLRKQSIDECYSSVLNDNKVMNKVNKLLGLEVVGKTSRLTYYRTKIK